MKKPIKFLLSSGTRKVIDDVNTFLSQNAEMLQAQYLSVMSQTPEGQKSTIDNGIYTAIDEDAYNLELLDVSLVITTANYFECAILNHSVYMDTRQAIMKLKSGIQLFPNDHRVIDAFILHIHGYTILHLHSPETGSYPPGGSSDLARYVGSCIYLRPNCIISFGICYGTSCQAQNLGNTIIAQKVYPWSIGIKITDDDWCIKSDDYIIDLRKSDPQLFQRIQAIAEATQNTLLGSPRMGNMLTSEAVVSNEKIKEAAIKKAHGNEIIGGEMEGYGLAKECVYYLNIPCVILKAICDWGMCKNMDEYLACSLPSAIKRDHKGHLQAYSAYCAYTVLKELLSKGVFSHSSFFSDIATDLTVKYLSDGFIGEDHLLNFLRRKYFSDTSPQKSEDAIKTIIDKLLATQTLSKDIDSPLPANTAAFSGYYLLIAI